MIEVGFIFVMFFVFAGSPPPDVGEAHYLAKARHYWDPAWCRGDIFLESKDAHGVFYWTFGWVTKFVSLSAAAWIGRCASWLLLAWAWQRLSTAIAPQKLLSILTAGMMLLFLHRFHMAGEWIVGGVEAKGFSYVLVLLALERAVKQRWPLAFLLAGGATALHVLVGGWTGVALGIAWLLVGRTQTPLVKLAPALVGSLALAAIAIVPALTLSYGADAVTVREANRIYVFDRLDHHLVFHSFEWWKVVRHGLLAAAWGWLAWRTCFRARLVTPEINLHAVVLGGVAIGLIGIAIDQGTVGYANVRGLSNVELQTLSAPLLKYYWFRLSDALLPVGVALAVGQWLAAALRRESAGGSFALIVAMLAVFANLGEIGYRRSQHRLPGSFLQPRPMERAADRSSAKFPSREQFDEWRRACQWAADNTPTDAKFLTPRRQQTFKWYAGRAEVASWKDVPQDAAAIVAWKRTLAEIFPAGAMHADLAFHSDAELVALAGKHGAVYILIDRTRSRRPIGLPLAYPQMPGDNRAYAIYRVPPAGP
ncbi:MAG TPA: DUF6798 domain-containing protein [Pirellulaceae bacterium]|nr:DUF6798 domain-containing protein [Pirellulaceae bacterium]